MVAKVVLKRLVEMLLTLWVTSLVVFSALYAVPGSPLAYLIKGRAADATTIRQITAEYHLDQPFLVRYWLFLSGLVKGDLGTSLVSHEGTWQLVAPRLGMTLLIVALALVETVVIGLLFGITAALVGRAADTVITVGSTVGVGIPAFAAAAALISLLAVNVGWFPVSGNGDGFLGQLWHATLPSIALAIGASAYMIRLTRASVRDESSREYVDTAKAQGLPWSDTVRKHILRNSVPSILTAGSVTFVGLLASEVVVESAFGINGIGTLLVSSVQAKDLAVVQVLMYVAAFMIVNMVTDLLALRVDPRLAIEMATR